MTERMIEADGVSLCTEHFGDPSDPPILLIMGFGASSWMSQPGVGWLSCSRLTTPTIPAIAVPTTVVHGTADPLFPIAHGQALAEEIPGAQLLRLEGADRARVARGHSPRSQGATGTVNMSPPSTVLST